ncbi:hypothetical protein ACCO45_004736 [Purpureocillium lilacinum]|uniref:Uncharacterized protein n=1 Tax=Purpureocillium lilacinum TaxID=33203 RepID=A0ACC4DUQ5_PURLI
MPRRNRRQQHDFDFDIHVDPSCMSEPTTYDDTMEQEVPKVEDHEVGAGEDALRYDEEALETRNALDADQELDMDQTDEAKAVLEEQPEEQEAFATEDERHEETLADKAAEELEAALEELVDGVAQQPVQEATEESTQAPDEDDAHSDAHDLSIVASEVSQSAHDVSDVHSEAPVSTADDQTDDTVTVNHAEHDAASVTDHDQSILGSEADTRDSVSRRESAMSSASHDSDRRASYRTEALIHAAARDIVQQLGRRESAPAADTADSSYVAGSEPTSARQSYGGESTVEHHDKDDDHNEEDVEEAEEAPEAGDSSSHHEHEDDVFSDDSPRSSMGSMSEAEQTKIEQTLSLRNITQRSHSPRISDIPPSDMDDQDFVATVRGTPRPPFRSPSSVRAMQMSSPPASVFGQTPRSNRRTPLPTVSRLDVLEAADAGDLSPEAKTLRDSWRQLQERTGDTVSDRGILLPHPQNDYEVLEERLLEALELPLRRRARILECGHYLGPANEMTLPEEMDSDCGDEGADKTHWCRTCKSEIRYDSLGQGRVFRVKVYASNGLMRAGAWEACWKEMERVDVELEPIVDAALSDELAELAAEQERAMEMRVAVAVEDDQHQEQQPEYEDTFVENQAEELVRDPEPTHPDEEEHRHHEERRRTVDEERLREIYGSTPPAHAEAPSSRRAKGESAYTTRETPPSPSVGAHARREHARQREAYQGGAATLPELLLEAVRVAMRDRKNVVIGLLSVLILLLAARAGERAPPPAATFQTVVTAPDAPLAKVEGQMAVESVSGLTLSEEDIVAAASVTASAMTEGESAAAYTTTAEQASQASDPCSLSVGDASTSIVRVVETVTETIRETVLETATVASPAPVATQETVASADPVATQEAELLLQQKMELPRSNDTTEVTPEEKSEEAVALLSDDDDAAAA